jgi:uncharacterized protein YbdZ (MbtH family)
VNHEEQYSIWFADRELPAGWTEELAGVPEISRFCWRLRM